MYIFKEVQAKVEKGHLTLDFHLSGDFISFKEAKNVADSGFLKQQLAAVYNAIANQETTTIDLTSQTSPESYLRGYQGGLLQVVDNTIVVPKRGLDAPSSPGKLDICAGRLIEKEEGDWLDIILGEGLEEVAIHNNVLYIPHLTGNYTGYNTLVRKRVLQTAKESGIKFQNTQDTDVEIIIPKNAATIRVHQLDKSYVLEFNMGWCALPNLSSVELFGYSLYNGFPKTVSHTDTETFTQNGKKVIVNREIYEIDIPTGKTRVWKGGQIIATEKLANLIERSRNEGISEPVSPKLKAAIEQWPVDKLGPIGSLEILLFP